MVAKAWIGQLSHVTWLEMGDLATAGHADRRDISAACFLAELRARHPEWQPDEPRRWSEGGMWHHTPLLAADPPYCAHCDRHYEYGRDDPIANGHRCFKDLASSSWSA